MYSVPITTNVVSLNPIRQGVLDTALCVKVCQWLTAGRWFSPCDSGSSTNKTYLHDINGILLKMTSNTITYTSPSIIRIKRFGSPLNSLTPSLFAPIPSKYLGYPLNISWCITLVFNDLRREIAVRFVDNWLNCWSSLVKLFLFIINAYSQINFVFWYQSSYQYVRNELLLIIIEIWYILVLRATALWDNYRGQKDITINVASVLFF